jgi:integrase
MRERLTPAYVRDAVIPPEGRKIYWDAATPSFGLMVTCGGARSFIGDYRNADGVKRRKTWPARTEDKGGGLTIDEAKREFRKRRGDAERGHDPVEEQRKQRKRAKEERRRQEAAATTTVKAIFESYFIIVCGMVRDADGAPTFNGRLRSAPWQMRYVFEPLVYPKIGHIQINELKRSEIVKMLDEIARDSGPVMADRALAHVRKGLNWYVSRTDDFRSPIVKGMARMKPKERAGKRVLADDEIRDIWRVCETDGLKDLPAPFRRFQRFLFLAACRRTEAAAMNWFEVESLTRDDFTGEAWTCPKERMKGKLDHLVPITVALLKLTSQCMISASAGTGSTSVSGAMAKRRRTR